jgi:hypothetical protein
MASHCLGKCVHGTDVAIQGSGVERDRDWSFFERGHFGLDAQPLFLELPDPLLGILLGDDVLDHKINVALPLAFDPITFRH